LAWRRVQPTRLINPIRDRSEVVLMLTFPPC
jgi:hypothetical protein